MLRLFLCTCVAFLSAETVSYGAVTSCQTPGNVQVGQLGAIHCFFPESVRDKKFIVVRLGPSSTEDEERIVHCYNINGVRDCDVLSGYNFTYTTGPFQTVFISKVAKQHEGTYICQLIPSDPNDFKSCYLKVKEARILDSSQKQEGKAIYNGDSDDNEIGTAPNQTGSNQTSTLPTGAIAGIVVGALIGFAVAVAVAVVVGKMRKQTCRKKRNRAAFIPRIIEAGGVTSSEKGSDKPLIPHTDEDDGTSSE